jgi:FAD/FMN-containing dehydrogenase/Fe-S oxidoreductase
MAIHEHLRRESGETRARVAPRRLPMVDDAPRLAAELVRWVRGEVRFDEGSRALYATDASNYRHIPIGVVVPRDANDAAVAIAVCRAHGAPIVGRGGGTSLAGQTCNAAVVLDFSKYLRDVVAVDPEVRAAWVEPGVVLDDLRARAEEFHLTFGPDPATHNRCTLGGMIGNNSCGVHSMMAGNTEHNVDELEVLTYDGARFTVGATSDAELERVMRAGGRKAELCRELRDFAHRHGDAIRRGFPKIPRRVSGYNLPWLLPENGFHVARALVGSEGTLVTVLGARVRLVPSPPERVLCVLGYDTVYHAADDIMVVREAEPIGLEGIDDVLLGDVKKKGLVPAGVRALPRGCGWLLVELGGDTREEALDRARQLEARMARVPHPPRVHICRDAREARQVWRVREAGLGATAHVAGRPPNWEGWEDSAVPPERLGEYLRELRALFARYGYHAALYGHFGQGCVHTRIPFDLRSSAGIAHFRSFVETAADLVVRFGGSLSGEHGDGQARAELLGRMFEPEVMRAFEELKAIFDPDDKMNPGKVVRPRRLDEDLRLGPEWRPRPEGTHFQFPHDHGSLAQATERCVGVGECRRTDGGVMCPSYMVTLEERDSTRGRAHLLFEMQRGGVSGGWKSEAVRESLDLCLSCKGCKSECPVQVDMATYKAEFLSHYYRGRVRPLSAYLFGNIDVWARIGSEVPWLANALLNAPGISKLAMRVAGMAPEREFPPLARHTFRDWWRSHRAANPAGPAVALWVDTFNDHWQPEVLIAAVRVLEAAGYRVAVPPGPLCCGRPLYDYGMLTRAKRLLRSACRTLAPAIAAGVPVVGVEPSCVAVFRDELCNLFPDDAAARRLAGLTMSFDELLASSGWTPPRTANEVIVHGHCHHKSVLRFDAETELLARAGIAADVLDAGCCGMAGGFGYERDHYQVSVGCGERKLLPAIRRAAPDAIVLADGFSCREQIRQLTGRRALHLAELLALALRTP